MKQTLTASLIVFALFFGLAGFFLWTFCRIQIPPGYMAILTAKVGAPLPANEILAAPGQKGVQRDPLPEGRHFRNPINFAWEIVKAINIPVGKIGVVTSKVGKELPPGEILAADHACKGIWKDVLGPGLYRLNPQGYEVTLHDAVNIPIGYVGIVTSQTGKPAPQGQFAGPGEQGVMRDVLQPGLYYINPRAYQVDILEIGMNQVSIQGRAGSVVVTKGQIAADNGGELQQRLQMNAVQAQQAKRLDYLERNREKGFLQQEELATASAEAAQPMRKLVPSSAKPAARGVQDAKKEKAKRLAPTAETVQQISPSKVPESAAFGMTRFVEFPSRDGFQILLDMTVEFELLPEHIAQVYLLYGDLPAVVDKILLPQILSISRLKGSSYKARDFIDGEGRQQFQSELTAELMRVMKEKHIVIHNALIRHVEVPPDILAPIQSASVSKEQDLTNQARQSTARKQAELNAQMAMIDQLQKQVEQETEKKVATTVAQTKNEVATIQAKTALEVAGIALQRARIVAQTTQIQGETKVKAEFMVANEKAKGEQLRAAVFKDKSLLADLVLTDKLNPEIGIKIIHAGPGTLWTDLKSFAPALPVAK